MSTKLNPEIKTLRLVKGKDIFQIDYNVGDEGKVLDHLIECVNNKELSFDWFDAAALSHQVSSELTKELKAFLPKQSKGPVSHD